jgi:sugar-specific transcriptional regulator TrmB
MTKDTIVTELEQLGFTANEANVYLALIQKGAMTATAIAAATGLARTAVYPTLNSLVDQGLVDAGEGYGSKFSAVPAERALPHLMLERERLTREVIERISSLEEREESAPDEELIQVIRSPRAVAERFERLQLEAERQIQGFNKPPFFIASVNRAANPVQARAVRRGVHVKALYEKAALEDPAIKPHLASWVAAGEEARVYDGELPHKLQIFDSQIVLMPLIRPGQPTKTLLIRYPQLAQSLSLAFEHLWERSDPVTATSGRKMVADKKQVRSKPQRHKADRDGAYRSV